MSIFSTKKSWIHLTIWVLIIALIIAAPSLLPVFRLNLLGRYLSLAIVALGVDLILQRELLREAPNWFMEECVIYKMVILQ